MHSALRRELCSTPRFLQSFRAPSTSRPRPRTRKFSNRPQLLSQPGSQDNDPKTSVNASSPPKSSKDTLHESRSRLQAIHADIERLCQVISDKGRQCDLVDICSVVDDNGKRRLAPHWKRDLEPNVPPHRQISNEHNALETREALEWQVTRGQKGEDGRQPQFPSSKIGDKHTQPLAESQTRRGTDTKSGDIDLKRDGTLQARDGNSNDTTRDDLQLDKSQETNKESQAPLENQKSPLQDRTESTQQVAPQILENNLVSKFHGSSAARRQRERQPRIKDKSPVVALPKWFLESNVKIRDETGSDHSLLGIILDKRTTDLNKQSIRVEGQPTPEVSESKIEDSESKTEDGAIGEKQQTHPAGPGAPVSSKPYQDETTLKQSSSSLIALSPPEKRYYIQSAQLIELLATVKGRLRLPAHGSPTNKPGGIRSHLLVHYLANNGDLFLDRLIEDVTRMLNCNLITLDAQDISALISRADIDPMLADEAKMLSYEIYSEIYDEKPTEEESSFIAPDDMEEADENGGFGMPQGIPFMVGKPITIDLKALFGPRNSRRSSSFISKNLMPELMGRASTSKPIPHIFQSIVESILSSTENKTSADHENATQERDASSQNVSPLPQRDATIVHVKDLKAIQETNIGKHFLAQLYYQVERRRSLGETIMIVGTSCDRGSANHHDTAKIRTMQVSEPEEISSTIVITPAYPARRASRLGVSEESEIREELQRTTIPEQDKSARLRIVNGRHLYEMLRLKDISLDTLPDGFWTQSHGEGFGRYDQLYLKTSFWSFSHVQRVAAILATGDYSESINPLAEACKVLQRSDELKYDWVKEEQPEKPRHVKTRPDTRDPQKDKIAQIRATATKHEKKLLSGVIAPQKIKTTFKDIHIPADTVEALQTLTTLSLVRPDAFKYGVLSSDRIPGLLLYGPPGTGKTLAAKAVARESGATMLEVSAADINDMYVGEGEKNVQALFSLAKKLSPCIVFLDEADAMFRARSNEGRRASHRELLNQFLKEWDGMSNDSGSAFIMVATNRPMDLDDAVLRRLPRRLLVDLPTEKDRLEILKIHLRHETLAEDVDLAKMASRTQFYSGSDLKNLAVAAALDCVQEENKFAKEHTGEDPYEYPKKRTLKSAHFDKALQEISASISEDMTSLKEIKKFDEQYGDRKGRKKKSAKWGFKTAAEADAVLDTVKVRS